MQLWPGIFYPSSAYSYSYVQYVGCEQRLDPFYCNTTSSHYPPPPPPPPPPPSPHQSALCLRCRAPPRSSALQQPSEVLINDKRDARAWKHPDDVRGQTAIKPCYALVRPGMCDRGWDGTVMGARKHRVVLLTFVSSLSCLFFCPWEGRETRRKVST